MYTTILRYYRDILYPYPANFGNISRVVHSVDIGKTLFTFLLINKPSYSLGQFTIKQKNIVLYLLAEDSVTDPTLRRIKYQSININSGCLNRSNSLPLFEIYTYIKNKNVL